MAATPQSGTMFARGVSGMGYSIDIYISDVNAAPVRFDEGAGATATSGSFWTPPENVTIEDISIVTGTVDTTKMRLAVQGEPKQQVVRYALHLTTLNNRPKLGFRVGSGRRVGFIQLT